MSSKWLITDAEDERLQGLSCEAQVMYMRGFRRYADYSTGVVHVTHGMLKRLIEFIPDRGSRDAAARVRDISTDYVRARIAELERAGLIVKQDKRNRFEAPVFCCVFAARGLLRPEFEPQMNPKDGTPSEKPTLTLVAANGTPNEPQGMNPKIPGNPVIQEANASLSESPVGASAPAVPPCPHLDIIALYHDTLPELPGIVASRWSGSKDATALQTRWREDKRHQSLEFWARFFAIVRTNPHWMGSNDRGWTADLRWLVKRSNFDKVIDRMACQREVRHG